jgi:uncharacterized protein (TIGR02099 family)
MSRFSLPGLFSSLCAMSSSLRHHRALRVLLWGATLGYFAFGLLLLVVRYLVLPQIANYRGDIEAALASALNRPVAIRSVAAGWRGLHPALTLQGFEIRDSTGRPALGFDQVEADLAWSSLWHFELQLARLEIDAPRLVLRRDPAGHLFAAGLEITPQQTAEPGFADWLLKQHRIVIRNAAVTWQDELRGAAPLTLTDLNFRLDNSGHRHRFGLSALPPAQLATRLDLRGDLKEHDRSATGSWLDAWQGDLYGEIDGADLAGWRDWVDYPVALPEGHGALRLWLGFVRQRITAATADVRLAAVRLQLQPDLPELDLLHLDGRIRVQQLEGSDGEGFEVETRGLSLATRDGLSLPATDFRLAWRKAPGGTTNAARNKADISASQLDLTALGRLAAYLPLPPAAREQLTRHAPRGHLASLAAQWSDADDTHPQWQIRGRFDNLGFAALGPVANASGISGTIDGTDRGGHLVLNGRDSAVELPAIFTQSRIEFAALQAELDWKTASDGLHVNLQKAAFQNQDAHGEASGIWHGSSDGTGPGTIDLTARLNQARGDAVWRYMPNVVGQDTHDWLHASITTGLASDVTLKLKGDLSQFPFRDGHGGLFEVRGQFRDATLRYASAWPEITGIDGELLFSGQRMLITGRKGRIFGVDLHDVKAEIADLEAPEELLTVSGTATGPTPDFLRFIEASPVGERIDHFTADMKATGNGTLALKLALPLRHLVDSKVEGDYRFEGNRLTVDADLPPLADVRGQLRFSADHLEAQGIRATLLTTPLSVNIKTIDGSVQIDAAGEVGITALRRQFSHPVLDHLSGSTTWNGTVRVRKKDADVKITSSLVGLSSSLPAPFNKSVNEGLPLSFERRSLAAQAPSLAKPAQKVGARATEKKPAAKPLPPAPRDMLDLRLGRSVHLNLVRRQDVHPAQVTQGLLTLGDINPPMPEHAVLVAVNLPRLDTDAWRQLLMPGDSRPATASSLPSLPALRFDLRSPELLLLEKNFHDVQISGERASASAPTRFELKSRELSGNFEWQGAGNGKLLARIEKFSLPETGGTPETLQAKANEVVDHLPALDISVGELSFRNRTLGSLRLNAENLEGAWRTRLAINNDDGTLEASARWRPRPAPADTQVDFKLTTRNIEKMLVRIGYPDAIRRGNATLSGNLAWAGPPFRINYPTLAGKLKLDAANGQFSKLEPGVGRLLGILSLQSLPRRITLDFRDIFSEGFAFDSISGQFDVNRGVLETSDLKIRGPAAKVLMSGSVNLGAETQNLKVRVQPALGESVAVGAMLAHPAVGAAVWVAQKILRDPLDQVFAYEYQITGGWADPKVEKLGQKSAPAQEPTQDQAPGAGK